MGSRSSRYLGTSANSRDLSSNLFISITRSDLPFKGIVNLATELNNVLQ